jgi:HSP20 family protein
MSNISLFDPMTNQMSRLLQSFGLRPTLFDNEIKLDMKIDVSEDEKNYIVRADMPGFRKEDIHVDVDGNRVTISAEAKVVKEEKKKETVIHSERYEGKLFRSFTLASNVNEAGAEASYRDGVLELKLQKTTGDSATRITIN